MSVNISGYPTGSLTSYQLGKIKGKGVNPAADSNPEDVSATDIAAQLNDNQIPKGRRLNAAIFTLMQIYIKDRSKADEIFSQVMGKIKDPNIKKEFESLYAASKKTFDLIQGKSILIGNGISIDEVDVKNLAAFQSIGLNFTQYPNEAGKAKINFNPNNCSVYYLKPDGSGAIDQTTNPDLYLDANSSAISITQQSIVIGDTAYPTAFYLTVTNKDGSTDTLVFIPKKS